MSTPAPELKEWMHCVQLSETAVVLHCNGNTADKATLHRNGRMEWDMPDFPFHKLRALIDEVERVGRHYWGDDWGRKK